MSVCLGELSSGRGSLRVAHSEDSEEPEGRTGAPEWEAMRLTQKRGLGDKD